MCSPKTMWKIGVAIVAALAVGWFVFPEVRARLVVLAPFAIVLICPLAMLFGMRGHGKHGDGKGDHDGHGGCCGDNTANARVTSRGSKTPHGDGADHTVHG